MVLLAGGTELAFGDRAADGRRYVRASDRLCLVADRARPLLRARARRPRRRQPAAPAARPCASRHPPRTPSAPTRPHPGASSAATAAPSAGLPRWQAAQAERFVLEPPRRRPRPAARRHGGRPRAPLAHRAARGRARAGAGRRGLRPRAGGRRRRRRLDWRPPAAAGGE
ncbi:MAG: hypothetical protein U5K43_03430 [Halofilum sp. (in: g-proteobacteria)]|nr:hypothetical protein [Halofilum sp. (in: g-proteobacteria)]